MSFNVKVILTLNGKNAHVFSMFCDLCVTQMVHFWPKSFSCWLHFYPSSPCFALQMVSSAESDSWELRNFWRIGTHNTLKPFLWTNCILICCPKLQNDQLKQTHDSLTSHQLLFHPYYVSTRADIDQIRERGEEHWSFLSWSSTHNLTRWVMDDGMDRVMFTYASWVIR